MSLDPTSNRYGYLLGRLFSHLQALDVATNGGDPATGTAFGKLTTAITSPAITLRLTETLGTQWLRKLAARNPDLAARHQQRITELVDRIAAATTVEPLQNVQMAFITGYHHQEFASDREAGRIITTAQVASILGLGSPDAARVQLRRWEIEPAGTDDTTGERLWRRDAIEERHRTRPGRGARTDLAPRTRRDNHTGPPDR